MNKLKNICAYNYLDLVICIFLFILLKDIVYFISFISLVLIYYYKNRKALLVILCFLILSIPPNKDIPLNNIGYIKDIKKSYYVVEVDKTKILLYSDKKLNYDDKIKFIGRYKKIEGRPSTYGFDFTKFNHKQGIYYQVFSDDIEILKEGCTIRNYIYRLSNDSYFLKFIFNINSDDTLIDNFISCGYCYIGFVYLFNKSTKIFLTKSKQDKINGIFYIYFAIFYQFNFSSFRLLLMFILKHTKLSYKQRIGIGYSICLMLYPHNIISMKFLLPFVASLITYFNYDKKLMIICNMILQNYLFNSLNVVTLFTYRYISYLLGLCYGLAWISLVVDVSIVVSLINEILGFIQGFQIKGSNASIILLVISILCYKCKYKYELFISLYIVCLFTGWFFPFASINYINVDQGDAILISDILNTHHYLIDTGKPSSYRKLKTFLDARSIKKIDILFISHYDSDHCGNLETLIQDYDIERVVDYHFEKLYDHNLTFYDLNDKYFKETNDSSQVIYTSINNREFIFNNDAPVAIEKDIINKYPKLTCDYLLVGHHGSRTSTCQSYLATIKPMLGIISSGLNNYYNHPNIEVVKVLENNYIPFFNTAYEGDISIYITSFFDIILTNNKKIDIIFSR